MKIQVKCFSVLEKYEPKNSDSFIIEENSTINDLMKKIKLPIAEVKIVFVNGHIVPFDTKIKENDRVAFFNAVGGG